MIRRLPQGIHDAVPAAAYHADPAPDPSISNSKIGTLLRQTPKHVWLTHPRLNPNFSRDSGGASFDIGTAAHSLFLEGVQCAVPIDAEDWRTKQAKDERAAARLAGKVPMLRAQFAATLDMVEAAHDFLETTDYRGLFSRAKPEQTVVWKDESVHCWCRARMDLLSDDRELILDYKTTATDGGPSEFTRRNMLAHGYDTQAVFYRRALENLDHRKSRFVFLVQESFEPFMCYLIEPAESMVELATHKVNRAMALWRDCQSSNRWPGYSTQVHQADAPVWAIKEEELA